MIRRALMVGVVAAAVLAPVAQARPSLVVQASAVSYNGGFEQMNVRFECAAVDVTGKPTHFNRCSFGSIYAPAGQCFECVNPPAVVTTGAGNVRLGLPYDLCVTATSYLASGPQTVSKCAPFSYLTGTAVIAG
jgi:hypothetical protein